MSLNRRHLLQATSASLMVATLPFGAMAQTAPRLKIGVIGSGRVGSTLGGAWIKAGHEVMFSSLDIEHDKKLAASLGGKASAGTTRQAAAFGSVLLISVPYAALPGIGRELANEIKGKVVIDTSNPIVARDGDMATAAREKGAGLASSEFLVGSRIVRAFNAVGFARMAEAAKNAGKMGMPIAGDDKAAIDIAIPLVREVGYEPVLVGTLATMGKYLIPGTPLAGERTPEDIRKILPTLK